MNPTQSITEIVLDSGPVGSTDNNGSDFDLLRDAVVTANLAGTLGDETQTFTVFAPNDDAFIALARNLGYDGTDEAGSLGYIVEALTLLGGGDPIPLLTNVLGYHVVAGNAFDKATVVGLGDGAEVTTSIGETVELNLDTDPPSLIDKDDGLTDPGLIAFDIHATNGIIHVLDGVLAPLSVTGLLSRPNTDFIIGSDDDDFYSTGRGKDFIDGNGGNDFIWAGSGADIVLGGLGNDFIFGQRGKDLLIGDEGHDNIFGGSGKDTIDGGDGNDRLFGGKGSDTFVFENGDDADLIIDFRTGQDKIDLSGYAGIDDFHDLEHHIKGGFFATVIDLDGDDRLTLLGVREHRLDADDFIFA
ncbi:MAG: fasciclin domain-containing protein [Pseudomonadota bacterium]